MRIGVRKESGILGPKGSQDFSSTYVTKTKATASNCSRKPCCSNRDSSSIATVIHLKSLMSWSTREEWRLMSPFPRPSIVRMAVGMESCLKPAVLV